MTKPKAKPKWGLHAPGICNQTTFTTERTMLLAQAIGLHDEVRIAELAGILSDRAALYLTFKEADARSQTARDAGRDKAFEATGNRATLLI